MARAFGIAATNDQAKAEAVAAECEARDYSSIWTNDGATDGILTAHWIADATATIRVGIGVVATDRITVPRLMDKVRDMLPLDRIVLGIGSGFSSNPVETVRRTVDELRQGFGAIPRIAVAAMGPRMCSAAGELADVVLLNWMTPERISWARKRISKGASTSLNSPQIASYIRVALGDGASDRLANEANRYASIPHYGKHFDAMGVAPADVGIAGENHEISRALRDYEQVLDESVVRGIPETDEVDATLRIVRATAP
jgi:alkanesulfonate monooxygenase SsuD/methylene tetrahydromethanopterin reductase-like flavin-dependent oxidoreductase (luciferase family)